MFSPALRVSALGLALGWLVASAGADDKKVELKVGDEAPSVQLPDENGKTWSSSDRFGTTTKKGKWVVIYFYPGDFTPGCTAQANAFRFAMKEITEKGVEVV